MAPKELIQQRGGESQLGLHVQRLLSLCGLVLGAVAHHGVALGQVEVECDQRAVLHAQGPQSGAIDLREAVRIVSAPLWLICETTPDKLLA